MSEEKQSKEEKVSYKECLENIICTNVALLFDISFTLLREYLVSINESESLGDYIPEKLTLLYSPISKFNVIGVDDKKSKVPIPMLIPDSYYQAWVRKPDKSLNLGFISPRSLMLFENRVKRCLFYMIHELRHIYQFNHENEFKVVENLSEEEYKKRYKEIPTEKDAFLFESSVSAFIWHNKDKVLKEKFKILAKLFDSSLTILALAIDEMHQGIVNADPSITLNPENIVKQYKSLSKSMYRISVNAETNIGLMQQAHEIHKYMMNDIIQNRTPKKNK